MKIVLRSPTRTIEYRSQIAPRVGESAFCQNVENGFTTEFEIVAVGHTIGGWFFGWRWQSSVVCMVKIAERVI